MKKRVGILISGRGFNMMALIEAARAQDYPAEADLFPPPSCRRRVFDTTWGRDREGGMAEHLPSRLLPPLTPPHQGEGDLGGVCGAGAS
jgi:hypothetical protein